MEDQREIILQYGVMLSNMYLVVLLILGGWIIWPDIV